MDEIHLWQWRFTDELGNRRVTSWRMSEEDVRQFAHVYKDAQKVEGSLEIRVQGSTGDWQQSPLLSVVGLVARYRLASNPQFSGQEWNPNATFGVWNHLPHAGK